MDIDFKKLAPWNWFKNEQQEQQTALPRCPCSAMTCRRRVGPSVPILQLHREIDRLFDDAFRGFGFPALAMPRLAVRLAGPAEAGPGHPGDRQAVQDRPGSARRRGKGHPDHARQRRAAGARREAPGAGERRTVASTGWSAPTAAFTAPLNLPDDADQDTIKAAFKNGVLTVTIDKREASAPKQGRSIPING
jgi:HSP20 family protein